MDIYFIIKALVLPPGAHGMLGLLGIAAYPRWPRTALALLVAAAGSAFLMGLPATAAWLARPLEPPEPFHLKNLAGRGAEAIVVLGGGPYQGAPEFNGADDASYLTLERLRYAARLQRLTGLPLAVTGGVIGGMRTPEGEIMRTSLETDFGVYVPWVETVSRNTAENALRCREQFPFKTIVLVTHAVHMPRARRAFEDAGFSVIPGPMGYITRPHLAYGLSDFVPNMKAYLQSQYALYELLGAVWYRYAYA